MRVQKSGKSPRAPRPPSGGVSEDEANEIKMSSDDISVVRDRKKSGTCPVCGGNFDEIAEHVVVCAQKEKSGKVVISPRRKEAISGTSPKTSPRPSDEPEGKEKRGVPAFLKGLLRQSGSTEANNSNRNSLESSSGDVAIVKTQNVSAFGLPISTMAVRTSSRGSIMSPTSSSSSSGNLTASHEALGTSPEAGDWFIQKKAEESVFPGFKVSTMATRPKQKKPTASEVMDVEEPQKSPSLPQLPPVPAPRPTPPPRPSIPPTPDFSRLDQSVLEMLAPVAKGRIENASKTDRLDLAGLKLGVIPEAVRFLPSLLVLNVAGNDLSSFGNFLSRLTALMELDASFNHVSDAICSEENKLATVFPPSLTNLSFRDCDLVEAPSSRVLQSVPVLSGLDLRFNKIASMKSIACCKNLAELLIGWNDLSAIEAGTFEGCSGALKLVDASNNQISSIEIDNLAVLERFNLANNLIQSVPQSLGALQLLTSLDLSMNKLTKFGSEFDGLKKLRSLRLRSNSISSIECSFYQLTELRFLDLSFNLLDQVPEAILSAFNLRSIILSGNSALEDLEHLNWTNLPFLSVFMCSATQLKEIPTSIACHPSIEVLDVSFNKLRRIPSLSDCGYLKLLNISGHVNLDADDNFVDHRSNSKLTKISACGCTNLMYRDLSCFKEFGQRFSIDFGTHTPPDIRINIDYAGFAETIGLRSSMEDRCVAFPKDTYEVYAVFDGHGGASAAILCAGQLESLMPSTLPQDHAEFDKLMTQVFAQLDQLCESSCMGGCTAVVACVEGQNIHVANVGDARAVLVKSAVEWQRLSNDHKVTDRSEAQRIRQSGGCILNGRVEGILEVTRALGDSVVPLCTPEPTVVHTSFVAGDVLVMGCDGVYDELSDAMVARLAKRFPREQARITAAMLRDEAFFLGSTDNISCFVVHAV